MIRLQMIYLWDRDVPQRLKNTIPWCRVSAVQGEGGSALPKEGDDNLPSKRRRFNVDYVALQKKLQVGKCTRLDSIWLSKLNAICADKLNLSEP